MIDVDLEGKLEPIEIGKKEDGAPIYECPVCEWQGADYRLAKWHANIPVGGRIELLPKGFAFDGFSSHVFIISEDPKPISAPELIRFRTRYHDVLYTMDTYELNTSEQTTRYTPSEKIQIHGEQLLTDFIKWACRFLTEKEFDAFKQSGVYSDSDNLARTVGYLAPFQRESP
ncbi:hypothetical protein COV18_05010 [Candidatus Woesearchaeota archaeon CG10_big_fil_rev_8_21_14_0_10_37_12]|nr:MAG: hypothetical protein COV18_05010 [Candidatus Woesearchaeota archaeon CG10_big_fil_rev_8_21_14_0_10_37_12]